MGSRVRVSSGPPNTAKAVNKKLIAFFVVYLYYFVFLQNRTECFQRTMRRQHIVDRIKTAMQLADPEAQVFVYGSEARGTARPDSDIDLLVLYSADKRDPERENRIIGVLYDIELSTGVIISPMILLLSQWENRPFKTPFYINVMNERIAL